MNPYQDITVGEHRYQVRRFTAKVGSFILLQLMTKMLPGIIAARIDSKGALPTSGASLTEAEFGLIQNHCLSACARYDEKVEHLLKPVMREGVFVIKDLEYDLMAIVGLTVQALNFNFSDFFPKDGAEGTGILDSVLSSSPSPVSTPTSSDPS